MNVKKMLFFLSTHDICLIHFYLFCEGLKRKSTGIKTIYLLDFVLNRKNFAGIFIEKKSVEKEL